MMKFITKNSKVAYFCSGCNRPKIGKMLYLETEERNNYCMSCKLLRDDPKVFDSDWSKL